MEMQQIRYFLALAELLNFTRAAERCRVAQPSLSRAIKSLERELGGVLFHRERANTHLTELGRTLKPYLEKILTESEQVKRKAAAFRRGKEMPLRLGLMCTIAPDYLLALVQAFQARHPGIPLYITDSAAPDLQNKLIAGELEAAVYALPEPAHQGLHYLALYREQFMIVMPREHPLAQESTVRVKDLHGERYLCRVNCEMGVPADRVFEEQKVDWPTVYESERDDWILAMAAAGLGLAFMPELSASHPGVVARPLVAPEFWREVALVTVRGRPHSPAVGALVAEAMRIRWKGKPALAVQAMRAAPEEEVTALRRK
jgi:LysR family transcriptional regulator, hydrogen peroxide-inducible genes activator